MNYYNNEISKTERKLFCILERVGYDMKNFTASKNKRIIFQKIIYAMQRNGIKFGFDYNLYLNGPYSPELASRGYLMARNLETLINDPKPFVLSAKGEEKIRQVLQYLSENVSDSNWLETITTLDYLKNEVCGNAATREEIYIKFSEIKPHLYDEEILNRAWENIERVGNND